MTTAYKDTFTYHEQHCIEHDVHGKKIRFYPNRYALLGDLAKVSKPMASALSSLFMESGREEAATTKNMKDQDGLEISEITMSAITPELARHRTAERQAAIETIFTVIEDFHNRILLGKLLMDSMRDDFPYKKDRNPKEVTEWLEGNETGEYHGIDLPTLSLLIGGWIKANAKVFGAQGEALVGAVKGKLNALRENSPSAQTTPTDGSNSKMASLPVSDMVSDSNSSNN